MSVKVKVQFDGDARMLKDRMKLTKCKKKLISQVIKDTTPYVPMQDGILYMSALVNQNRYKDKIIFYLIKNKSNKYLSGEFVASVYSGRSHDKRVL